MPLKKLVNKLFGKPSTKPTTPLPVVAPERYQISVEDIPKNIVDIINKLSRAGYQSYLVGGSVRDLLLRIAPKDFDIATNAKPEAIRKLFRNSRLIGRRFRLVHIFFGREIVEVSTFRASQAKNSKHLFTSEEGLVLRDNVFGTIEDDAWRRDFTINALYYDPNRNCLIDYTGGLTDVLLKTIRIIGDPNTRFREDPVRMLRAIRFASKLNFSIDPSTSQPFSYLKELIKHVSPARLFDEIIKLFHSGHGLEAYYLLKQYKLFDVLFPLTTESLSKDLNREKLLIATFSNTDKRIHDNKPVTPAFLFTALLWWSFQDMTETTIKEEIPFAAAKEKAISLTLSKQKQRITIPKRYLLVIKEIWNFQYQLAKGEGKKAFRLLAHPRFRASYDFLVLRAQSGDCEVELSNWWTQFQESTLTEQQKMIYEHKPAKRKQNTKT